MRWIMDSHMGEIHMGDISVSLINRTECAALASLIRLCAALPTAAPPLLSWETDRPLH